MSSGAQAAQSLPGRAGGEDEREHSRIGAGCEGVGGGGIGEWSVVKGAEGLQTKCTDSSPLQTDLHSLSLL